MTKIQEEELDEFLIDMENDLNDIFDIMQNKVEPALKRFLKTYPHLCNRESLQDWSHGDKIKFATQLVKLRKGLINE